MCSLSCICITKCTEYSRVYLHFAHSQYVVWSTESGRNDKVELFHSLTEQAECEWLPEASTGKSYTFYMDFDFVCTFNKKQFVFFHLQRDSFVSLSFSFSFGSPVLCLCTQNSYKHKYTNNSTFSQRFHCVFIHLLCKRK